MAGRCASHSGGIRRLQRLAAEHGDALEADLILSGLRLRDCPSREFDWRDLHVFVKYVGVRSNLYRAMFPDSANWDLTNQLLAAAVDIGNWFVWARQGGKGERPDRIPRPGVAVDPKHRKKGTPMKLSDAKVVYAAVGPGGASPDTLEQRQAKLRKIFGHGE